ncbi:MAG: hypothetical protein ACR2HQ_00670 [Ilumatobacteraceae bacterium]
MFDAGSCRRTTTTCGGREGYRPDTALTTLQRLGDGHEVLVMVAGYNDPGSSFATSVDLIMNAAGRTASARSCG